MPISFPSNPASNQTYTFNGITWTYNGNIWTKGGAGASSGGGASVTVSNAAPSSPTTGALWIDSEYGDLNGYVGNSWITLGGGSGVVANPPIIGNIVGNITSVFSSTFTVYGNNLGVAQGTLRFSFGGVVADVYVVPTTTTSLVATVPPVIYGLSSGTTGNLVWYRPDGQSTNAYVVTLTDPPLQIEYLVVGAGGGGGETIGGGGGAGEVIPGSFLGNLSTNYTVTIGGGGSGGNGPGYPGGTSGTSSIFSNVTAYGGGAGGGYDLAGSGPGGGHGGGTGASNGAGVSAGLGRNNGGTTGGNGNSGGGGGGAGGVGGNATSGVCGAGGIGANSSITGTSVAYGGGGGGGARVPNGGTAAPGGLGGGGGGSTGGNANNGNAYTGGGGGGGGYTDPSSPGAGGAGGSGIVILKFPAGYSITVNPGLTSTPTTSGGFKIVSFTAGTGTVTFSK